MGSTRTAAPHLPGVRLGQTESGPSPPLPGAAHAPHPRSCRSALERRTANARDPSGPQPLSRRRGDRRRRAVLQGHREREHDRHRRRARDARYRRGQRHEPLHEAVRAGGRTRRCAAAVFSHHHVDHIFGVGPFEQEARGAPLGAAARLRHTRSSARTSTATRRRSAGTRRSTSASSPCRSSGFAGPTSTATRTSRTTRRLTFRAASLTFELHHGRGETDDAHVDLGAPSASCCTPATSSSGRRRTPATRRRCSATRASGRRRCGEMAALGAETLLARPRPADLRRRPHPAGAHRHRRAARVARIADARADEHRRDARPRAARGRRCPRRLLDKPYLRPVYDHPQFIVRNIWRLYGGWYDGEPDNLLPAPRAEQAREWVALAGGIDARARPRGGSAE